MTRCAIVKVCTFILRMVEGVCTVSVMNATQLTYAAALATYQTALANYESRCAAAGLVVTSDTSDADAERIWDAMDALHAEEGLGAKRDAVTAAEAAMVEWAHGVALAQATRSERAQLAGLVARARRSVTAWSRMVDAAYRLGA